MAAFDQFCRKLYGATFHATAVQGGQGLQYFHGRCSLFRLGSRRRGNRSMIQRAALSASHSLGCCGWCSTITLAWSLQWATSPSPAKRVMLLTTRLPARGGKSKMPVGTPEVAASHTMDMLSGVTQTAREVSSWCFSQSSSVWL